MPVPAVRTTVWSGAVFVTVMLPDDVIGPPVTLMPVPAERSTLVTVPVGFATHSTSVAPALSASIFVPFAV